MNEKAALARHGFKRPGIFLQVDHRAPAIPSFGQLPRQSTGLRSLGSQFRGLAIGETNPNAFHFTDPQRLRALPAPAQRTLNNCNGPVTI